MGNLMYLLPNSSKKITETNLQLCFPEKNSKEISYLTKAHHVGSELSCIDIFVALYFKIMNIYPNKPTHKDRDYFILSKGHAALALYVTLMKKGFFSESYLLYYKILKYYFLYILQDD